MGAIHNIRASLVLALLAGLAVLAPAAAADEPTPVTLDPIEAPGVLGPATTRAGIEARAPAELPLTRAASRQRVDGMSPLEWLARYGHVVVGRGPDDASAPSR